MKVQRHRDGSYSITEMSAQDVRNLSFAASTAETWYWQHPDVVGEKDWNENQKALYCRLEKALRAAADARRNGTIELEGGYFGDADDTDTYKVRSMRGLKDWDGNAPKLEVEAKVDWEPQP